MDFTPLGLSVGALLQSEKFYTIPKYQRDYVWSDQKINNLWKDVIFNINVDENAKYFLGSVIIKTTTTDKEIVVDGQQRLTSILLLLGNICQEFIRLNDNFNIAHTKKYCVLGDTEEQKDRSRILNDDHPILEWILAYCISDESKNKDLEEYLKDLGIEKFEKKDLQLLACYNIYHKSIQDYINNLTAEEQIQKLKVLRESILKISIVKIQVENTRSASLVFETINARGQTLEIQDLIKNYLFMYEKVVAGRSVFEPKWDKIINTIETCKDSSLPRFFSHYCTSFFGKKKQSDIYETFKDNTPRDKVSERIKSLESVSKIYAHIVNGTDGNRNHKELNHYLTCFNDMGVSILRPVLISILLAFTDSKIDYTTLCKEVKRMVAFFSIYVGVCSIKTNALEDLIYSAALKLQVEFSFDLLKNFIDSLIQKLPGLTDFITSFRQIAYSNHKSLYPNIVMNKKKAQYILREFEIFLQGNEDFSVPSFSIEHIKDDKDGGMACYIGNFIPLPPRKNGKLSGKTMDIKQKTYERSCFSSTRKFAEHPECLTWNDENIQKRSEALAKEFYNNIWKL